MPVITSGQRILTKDLITGADLSRGNNVMWHRPVGSNAVRCSSGAVIPLLICLQRTTQQWLIILSNGPDNP